MQYQTSEAVVLHLSEAHNSPVRKYESTLSLAALNSPLLWRCCLGDPPHRGAIGCVIVISHVRAAASFASHPPCCCRPPLTLLTHSSQRKAQDQNQWTYRLAGSHTTHHTITNTNHNTNPRHTTRTHHPPHPTATPPHPTLPPAPTTHSTTVPPGRPVPRLSRYGLLHTHERHQRADRAHHHRLSVPQHYSAHHHCTTPHSSQPRRVERLVVVQSTAVVRARTALR